MNAARASWLDRLRRAAYRRLGRDLPDFSRQSAPDWQDANDAVLAAAGPLERQVREALVAAGAAPEQALALAAGQVRQLRGNVAQIARNAPSPQRLAAALAVSPPGVDPRHVLILQQVHADLGSAADPPDAGALVERWRALRDEIEFTTLPTGEINARAMRCPYGGSVIAFEPAFFDLFYHVSNAFADAIDIDKATAMARRHAGGEAGLKGLDAIRFGDASPVVALFDTFAAFAFNGAPPANLPGYRAESFELAEHLRRSGLLFVGAHEVAHLLLGHLETAATDFGASREQELQADRLGWLLADAAMSRRGVHPMTRAMGAALFLIAAMMIELVRTTCGGVAPSLMGLLREATAQSGGTHPAAALRLLQLYDLAARERQPPQLGLATEFLLGLLLDVGEQFWLRIGPDLHGRFERGARPAPSWEGWDAFAGGREADVRRDGS
jgi:hypothetical protein